MPLFVRAGAVLPIYPLMQYVGEKEVEDLTLAVYPGIGNYIHYQDDGESFAYKKGIPNDPSGNGGGFVFDCRAINNPGKYERYNHFTGLDEPVIQFLEDDGEITNFLEHVYHIVDASVKRYMDRGFTNLMICFGCTGGQHRSVYSAQHLAEHLNTKFGVKVHLVHREQNIEQLFNPTL